jgi:hypothetical protein
MGKQGSGKTTRVLSALKQSFDADAQLVHSRVADHPEILGNHYNHIAFNANGELVFVGGVHIDRQICKVASLKGTFVLEFPHAGYIPAGSARHLNNRLIRSKIFCLRLPEAVWKGIGGATGAITSPDYFMIHGRKELSRHDCDYAGDLARIRADIERSGLPVAWFDNADAMIEPIRDFLMFPTDSRGKWTDDALRNFVATKIGKTRARGHQGKVGLLGYQVIDFGNGVQSEGDTRTLEKVAFLVQRANLPVKEHSFLDLGCNLGSVIFELKKRGARECIGVDTYEPALDVARAVNEHWFQFSRVEFRCRSIADDWTTAPLSPTLTGRKVDYALALSVLHKDGVRSALPQVITNVAQSARNLVAEVPLQPEGNTDWDYARVVKLLEEHYVVERLPDTDFHSMCSPRALLLCRERRP